MRIHPVSLFSTAYLLTYLGTLHIYVYVYTPASRESGFVEMYSRFYASTSLLRLLSFKAIYLSTTIPAYIISSLISLCLFSVFLQLTRYIPYLYLYCHTYP